jgi:hypothetical protein
MTNVGMKKDDCVPILTSVRPQCPGARMIVAFHKSQIVLTTFSWIISPGTALVNRENHSIVVSDS